MVIPMGVKIVQRRAVHPQSDPDNDPGEPEYFYAGEVAAALEVERIEYRQLRELIGIVRNGDVATDKDKWLKLSLVDIAALRIAVDLVGGREAFAVGRRIRLSPLRATIDALRAMGIAHPLIEVPLSLVNGRVFAAIDGHVVDPSNGQALLGSTADLMGDKIPLGRGRSDALQRLRSEQASASSTMNKKVIVRLAVDVGTSRVRL